jgi:hypothetical protein
VIVLHAAQSVVEDLLHVIQTLETGQLIFNVGESRFDAFDGHVNQMDWSFADGILSTFLKRLSCFCT